MINDNHNNIIIYTTEDNSIKVELKIFEETAWLTQKQISQLFEKNIRTINEHIINVFKDKECNQEQTIRKFRIVQTEGEREVEREVIAYNIDIILAVGYRVRSKRGMQFRKWATTTLKEYLVKGFVMNDDRLKNPKANDYFDELLERIKDIRSSEKRFYQKVKDIYKMSIDYDKNDSNTIEFFKKIQNKLLHAATGNTAAEIINNRADHTKPNMGLTSYKGNKVRKQDIAIAKNYLSQPEIEDLNSIVTMYLDHAVYMAQNQRVIHMKDWEEKLNGFLQFNHKEILQNAGKISNDIALKLAEAEYEKFTTKRLNSDKELDNTEIIEELEKQLLNLKK